MPRRTAVHQAQVQRTDRQGKRTLATNCAAWRRLRARVLTEQPLCADCAKRNRITAATQVDHVDGDPSNNERHNLQGLCASCHSSKTNREQGGFGNPKTRT